MADMHVTTVLPTQSRPGAATLADCCLRDKPKCGSYLWKYSMSPMLPSVMAGQKTGMLFFQAQ